MAVAFLVQVAVGRGDVPVTREDFPSPSKKLRLVIIQPYRENQVCWIETAEGQRLSEKCTIDLQRPDQSVLWRPDGKIVALSSGTHFLYRGYAFAHTAHGWRLLDLPEPEHGWDNFYVIPRQWTKNVLSMSVSGPHTTRDNGSYSGTISVAFEGPMLVPKKIEERIK